jgi:mannose-6-phosphate isomerase
VAIERAHARIVQKPWGSLDLQPWAATPTDGAAVGELWYERSGDAEAHAKLLLKVLITKEQLSIQVHPDDIYARSIGLPWGKTEAWYILSAEPGAKVGVGLKRAISRPQLRQAIDDGSIADLIQWRPVVQGDVVFVPAGTIHTIGPGLTLAEIQQHSDTTFRMFDFGRGRELHVTDAVAAANPGPAGAVSAPVLYSDARTLLIVDPHFVLERIDLLPGSNWSFHAAGETWLLALRGSAQIGPFETSTGDALLIEGEQVRIEAGDQGLKCLAAYPGPEPQSDLLNGLRWTNSQEALPHQPGVMTVPPNQQETQP